MKDCADKKQAPSGSYAITAPGSAYVPTHFNLYRLRPQCSFMDAKGNKTYSFTTGLDIPLVVCLALALVAIIYFFYKFTLGRSSPPPYPGYGG